MKIRVSELNRIKGSLAKLLVAAGIPPRVCYRATKFSKVVVSEIESLETARIALVRRYGVETKGGLSVSPVNQDQFEGDFNSILAEEVELPDLRIASGDLEKSDLTFLDYANLDFLIFDSTEGE